MATCMQNSFNQPWLALEPTFPLPQNRICNQAAYLTWKMFYQMLSQTDIHTFLFPRPAFTATVPSNFLCVLMNVPKLTLTISHKPFPRIFSKIWHFSWLPPRDPALLIVPKENACMNRCLHKTLLDARSQESANNPYLHQVDDDPYYGLRACVSVCMCSPVLFFDLVSWLANHQGTWTWVAPRTKKPISKRAERFFTETRKKSWRITVLVCLLALILLLLV